MLEAFPAVTVPPLSLKLGRSFLNFTGSNWQKAALAYRRWKIQKVVHD